MPKVKHRTPLRGEEIELAIDSVAFGGAGIGRCGEMAVFVPFTVDGDRVSVEITGVKKRFATASLKSIRTPSPFRATPRCAAYTFCGACSYQHIAYEHQLAIKTRQVRDALERIGRFHDLPLKDAIPSPQVYGYRGKADLHVEIKKGGGRAVGFAARATNRIVDLSRCEIVHESINEALPALKRGGSSSGRFPVWSAPAGETPESRVIRRAGGREMLVPRDGFFQANLYLTDTLARVVLEFCGLSGTETVIDCYCGSGLFSLFLAPFCGRIYGIEADGDAVRCAEENLKQAGIHTASFYAGDVAPILRERFIGEKIPVDVALVDPPRTGLGPEALAALGGLNAPKIVYVSCDPPTLARDLRVLDGFGYAIRRVQPLDMFPQTSHIETVVLLERDHAGAPGGSKG